MAISIIGPGKTSESRAAPAFEITAGIIDYVANRGGARNRRTSHETLDDDTSRTMLPHFCLSIRLVARLTPFHCGRVAGARLYRGIRVNVSSAGGGGEERC